MMLFTLTQKVIINFGHFLNENLSLRTSKYSAYVVTLRVSPICYSLLYLIISHHFITHGLAQKFLSLSLSPGCVGVNVCDEILTRKRYLPTYLGAATEILLPSQQKVRLHYGKSRICFISRNDLAFVEWDAKWYLRICQGEFFRYLLRYPFF